MPTATSVLKILHKQYMSPNDTQNLKRNVLCANYVSREFRKMWILRTNSIEKKNESLIINVYIFIIYGLNFDR